MVWLLDGQKIGDTITRFDRIRERVGQTDGRTPHDSIGRSCTASRGKKTVIVSYEVSWRCRRHCQREFSRSGIYSVGRCHASAADHLATVSLSQITL